MRNSPHCEPLVMAGSNDAIGIRLEAGGCAEHEGGISYLQATFGIGAAAALGFEHRLVTQMPEQSVLLIEPGRDELVLLCGREARYTLQSTDAASIRVVVGIPTLDAVPEVLRRHVAFSEYFDKPGKDGLRTVKLTTRTNARDRALWLEQQGGLRGAWSNDSLVVSALGAAAVARVRDVTLALVDGDLAISLGGAGPFGGGSLNLLIGSKVGAELRAQVLGIDVTADKLKRAVTATGIEDELKRAGKVYHALSPLWGDESETSLVFFLNPYDQQRCHYGWVTVADLQSWARDEGPIVKRHGSEVDLSLGATRARLNEATAESPQESEGMRP